MINGIVYYDKPAGWTSFDVVNKVRNTLEAGLRNELGDRQRLKVGHSGTLDPFATGLLIIAYGSCTKNLGDMMKSDKTYQGTMKINWTSTTGDIDGGISKLNNHIEPQTSEIEHAFRAFVGSIEQIPPAHSAIKVDGVRSYKLARQGEEPELHPRHVKIHSIKLLKYRYPEISFECRVSSGTYIRTLARDIAKALGTDAYLEQLRRTWVGDVSVDGALDPKTATYQEILENSNSC